MEEPEFWQRLEFRICAEFEGFADRRLRFYWCDGLFPEEFDLAGGDRQITGVALCGNRGHGLDRWQFTLVLSRDTASRDQIDWSALLPSDRLTGWLTPDPQNKTLRLEPLSGYDD
jgi:hypothetical protein